MFLKQMVKYDYGLIKTQLGNFWPILHSIPITEWLQVHLNVTIKFSFWQWHGISLRIKIISVTNPDGWKIWRIHVSPLNENKKMFNI